MCIYMLPLVSVCTIALHPLPSPQSLTTSVGHLVAGQHSFAPCLAGALEELLGEACGLLFSTEVVVGPLLQVRWGGPCVESLWQPNPPGLPTEVVIGE
jgi:hypothetical protein